MTARSNDLWKMDVGGLVQSQPHMHGAEAGLHMQGFGLTARLQGDPAFDDNSNKLTALTDGAGIGPTLNAPVNIGTSLESLRKVL